MDIYCDNEMCDARTMTVLVQRDGADAAARADVRALKALDGWEGRTFEAVTFGELLERGPSAEQRLAARRNPDTFTLEIS